MAMRKGDAAKAAAINTILNTFEGSFMVDKKLYINVKDGPNGEMVQLAIALTMPKTPVTANAVPVAAPKVDTNAAAWESKPSTPTKLSADDEKKVADLCARLGI